jgi:hypothetical protein
MRKASWTYEQPPGGEGAVGLEDYIVYTAEENAAGKVTSLLRRQDELYLVVDQGAPPLTHDRRAVPWAHVRDVDHAALAVNLSLSASELDRMPELDPGLAVEPHPSEEHPGAAARRVTDLPPEADPAPASPDARGPEDRSVLYAASLGLGLFAVLGLLGVVALVSVSGGDLVPFFLVPIALGALSLFLGYKLWRRPYEGPPEGRSDGASR